MGLWVVRRKIENCLPDNYLRIIVTWIGWFNKQFAHIFIYKCHSFKKCYYSLSSSLHSLHIGNVIPMWKRQYCVSLCLKSSPSKSRDLTHINFGGFSKCSVLKNRAFIDVLLDIFLDIFLLVDHLYTKSQWMMDVVGVDSRKSGSNSSFSVVLLAALIQNILFHGIQSL